MKMVHQRFSKNFNHIATCTLGFAITVLSSQVLADAFYRVKSGDTLNSIANQYNVTVQQLVDINNFKSPNEIRVGDLVTINDSSAKIIRAPRLIT